MRKQYKLVHIGNESYAIDEENFSETYDSRIKEGMPFYNTDLNDICIAAYSPASKISRLIIASTDPSLGLPLIDKSILAQQFTLGDIKKAIEYGAENVDPLKHVSEMDVNDFLQSITSKPVAIEVEMGCCNMKDENDACMEPNCLGQQPIIENNYIKCKAIWKESH